MRGTPQPRPSPEPALSDDDKWAAVLARDALCDGLFYFSVASTGIYCRPSCPARRPKRANVGFHATPADAERAGYRACKRCHPDAAADDGGQARRITLACRLIETAETQPRLDEIARAVGLSPFHFHRVFKAAVGVTPKAYADAHRRRRVRENLARAKTVTEAIHDAGYNSSARFYASSTAALGMSPKSYRAGGDMTEIRFAVGQCSLGSILVAASDKGIAAILMGDDAAALVRDLEDRFPRARLEGGDREFEKLVARVVGFVEQPRKGLDLPLDIRGTAFEQRVWTALKNIPAGATATYADIARRIGQPTAARAVARACAANAHAVAIPCHRVVRTDGGLSGYRWGIARKRELLAREAGTADLDQRGAPSKDAGPERTRALRPSSRAARRG